jgi:hypothetical protein
MNMVLLEKTASLRVGVREPMKEHDKVIKKALEASQDKELPREPGDEDYEEEAPPQYEEFVTGSSGDGIPVIREEPTQDAQEEDTASISDESSLAPTSISVGPASVSIAPTSVSGGSTSVSVAMPEVVGPSAPPSIRSHTSPPSIRSHTIPPSIHTRAVPPSIRAPTSPPASTPSTYEAHWVPPSPRHSYSAPTIASIQSLAPSSSSLNLSTYPEVQDARSLLAPPNANLASASTPSLASLAPSIALNDKYVG